MLRLFWIIIGIIVVIGIANEYEVTAPSRSDPPSSSAPSRSDPPSSSGPQLHVLAFSCSNEDGYAHVRGEVRSLASRPIENLMVIGELRQADGTLIKTAEAMVEYDPLMPGQASPFHALTPHNPLATNCGLAFKTLWGGQIAYTK
jgi:hypothetical protein